MAGREGQQGRKRATTDGGEGKGADGTQGYMDAGAGPAIYSSKAKT